ncbi:uncharacterized protein LOC142886167 [Nelusetta ayraudi]|uniref:uncharacterized protein LOC142886167 n=1 Tax=Nelusetta ayraudi TaxID=303726 RepID=UPI003F72BF80
MAPNTSSDSLSNALEALAEVTLANFTQAQVQDDTFVRKVFHVKIRPFLASSSSNFLFCLSTKNFSCQTYQTVVQALDSQMALMDRERQRAVFTHFMRAFLSRNDSSEPGCVSRNMSSTEWIQANLGSFSKFATLEDLLALNSNFSSAEALTLLVPTQLAQLTLSSGLNLDTEQIDQIFDVLEGKDAFQNVDQFLEQLSANETVPDFPPVVRDRLMNRTFTVIRRSFSVFTPNLWRLCFRQRLIPLLSSFTAKMLSSTTSYLNCTNYRIVVSGLTTVSPAMTPQRRQNLASVMLQYLNNPASTGNRPGCRLENESDAEWLQQNFAAFSQNLSYADLTGFNISGVAVLNQLTPSQTAALLLDTNSPAYVNETIAREVLTGLTERQDDGQLEEFFQEFANISDRRNITFLENVGVRDAMLNVTLAALAQDFQRFQSAEFALWFKWYLFTLLPSFGPVSVDFIPRNISCESYAAILGGLEQSLQSLPLHLSHNLRAGIEALQNAYSVPAKLS